MTRADSTKIDESGSACSSDTGVKPEFIQDYGKRKRAFHRAIKRGNPCAVRRNKSEVSIKTAMDALKSIYEKHLIESVWNTNAAFLGISNK
mgnify:CR=1 FL=1